MTKKNNSRFLFLKAFSPRNFELDAKNAKDGLSPVIGHAGKGEVVGASKGQYPKNHKNRGVAKGKDPSKEESRKRAYKGLVLGRIFVWGSHDEIPSGAFKKSNTEIFKSWSWRLSTKQPVLLPVL
jgi:hypothetical protein